MKICIAGYSTCVVYKVRISCLSACNQRGFNVMSKGLHRYSRVHALIAYTKVSSKFIMHYLRIEQPDASCVAKRKCIFVSY